MFSFVEGLAQNWGFHSWREVEPEPDSEIILMFATEIPAVTSWRAIEFVRGWYSSWTEGQNITGSPLGLKSSTITDVVQTAFLVAKNTSSEPAVFINPKINVGNSLRPGIMSTKDPEFNPWWIGVDEVIPGRNEPAHAVFGVKRARTQITIRHEGQVYPIDLI